ncbi:MAG: phosphoglycerate dehydrogenase [Deltaproteobacteria bacterium]|nr:phosphoglycerate dehydrogenase [Deltaproteobacteria bacterium]
MSKQLSFPKHKITILLLEGIHPAAVETFRRAGYAVESVKHALSEEELLEAAPSVHLLGIRSKTQITQRVIRAAPQLLAIGCYCIGTNQVDLESAASAGIPVFNAPFSNTRSVAELTIAEAIMLARKASHKSLMMHSGRWDKSAEGCFEVRNKVLGIVGYGHIGPQVGLLAEAFGMKVVFFDIAKKLPLGNAQPLASLKALLQQSDFVALHVPETPATRNMIGKQELDAMKQGSYLLNLSRGSVVDIAALAEALRKGSIAGAAVDVFPEEPSSNNEVFESDLRGLDNVILTPHIGGSTLEAQHNIGIEVSSSLVDFTDSGRSAGAVNFPQVDLPMMDGSHRVLNIHRNVPGVLKDITGIVAAVGGNIRGQYLGTMNDIGYLIMDVDQSVSRNIKREIEKLETNIRTRLLF